MATPPILYLIFNRPDLQQQSFAPIAAARPAKLFIAADGPRPDREGEAERCAEARRIVEQVDWPCEVRTLFRSENLGCRKAVSEAITWFFDHVEEGIILEDDCVADASFFPFCAELLKRYRDDERIMAISGDNFQPQGFDCGASYYFSKYPHCWGWGTWRRSWCMYDALMTEWENNKDRLAVLKNCLSSGEIEYWTRIIHECYRGNVDTWDVVWVFSCWRRNGLTILPCVNLVENIGFGSGATHTFNLQVSYIGNAETIKYPLIHPMNVSVNRKADKVTDMVLFSGGDLSLRDRLRRLYWRLLLCVKRRSR